MKPRFPMYQDFEAAAQGGCFQCETPLTGEVADYDFPDGSGRYGLLCPSCSMVTFFDVQSVAVQ